MRTADPSRRARGTAKLLPSLDRFIERVYLSRFEADVSQIPLWSKFKLDDENMCRRLSWYVMMIFVIPLCSGAVLRRVYIAVRAVRIGLGAYI